MFRYINVKTIDMSKAFIILFLTLITSTLLSAQEAVKIQVEQKAVIREQTTQRETNSYTENNSSVSTVARETAAGPGKGGIVSSEAKRLGYFKRHRIGHARPETKQNDSDNGRQMNSCAAAFRHNGMYAGYAMRGALRCGMRGRR
jgi:hypothetical protein